MRVLRSAVRSGLILPENGRRGSVGVGRLGETAVFVVLSVVRGGEGGWMVRAVVRTWLLVVGRVGLSESISSMVTVVVGPNDTTL
jgi:hypothetical protein